MSTSFKGRVRGWAIGALARAEVRDVGLGVTTTSLLGVALVHLAMQRPAPQKLRDERLEVSLLAVEALGLGTHLLQVALGALHAIPGEEPGGNQHVDGAEADRIALAAGAAYLLASLARDGGRSREHARGSIEHALIGWLWNAEHPTEIAARAVALVYGPERR